MSARSENFKSDILHMLLKSTKDRGPARYMPNRGNAGDSLIVAATWQLFERLDMAQCIETGGKISAGDNVIYAGGGNLIPEYKEARTIIEQCIQVNVNSFILLPHSICGNEDLLQEMDDRFHIFCREQQSYAHALRFARRAHVVLTHDLAFSLDVGQLGQRRRANLLRLAVHSQPGVLIPYLRWRLDILPVKPQHGREMHLMRTDLESRYPDVYPEKYDLSSKHQSAYQERWEAELVSGDFIHALDCAGHIVSDRLHVCIGGALLGKRVTMLDNSYGKNRSVFLHSIQANFPQVSCPQPELSSL